MSLEGGREGREGRGGEGRGGRDGERREGREGKDDYYTYYSDGTIYSVYRPTIRLMHDFSRERQPLYCDVIIGKQIILN